MSSRSSILLALAAATLVASTCSDGPTRPRDELPVECGGFEGVPCPQGQTCDLPAGQCETADLRGVCEPIPEACILIYEPVCGCDGVTYGNDCERLRARVQKRHDGECG